MTRHSDFLVGRPRSGPMFVQPTAVSQGSTRLDLIKPTWRNLMITPPPPVSIVGSMCFLSDSAARKHLIDFLHPRGRNPELLPGHVETAPLPPDIHTPAGRALFV